MSTDYDALCVDCKKSIHVGQVMAGWWSFGYGTGDALGARQQGEWIYGHVVQIVNSDALPDDIAHEDFQQISVAAIEPRAGK